MESGGEGRGGRGEEGVGGSRPRLIELEIGYIADTDDSLKVGEISLKIDPADVCGRGGKGGVSTGGRWVEGRRWGKGGEKRRGKIRRWRRRRNEKEK